MAAGPSVVRYAKRRRVGERLGGRKKIIRGLGGAVFRRAGLRAAIEIGGSAEKMIEGLPVVRSRGSPRPWLRAADNHGYRRLLGRDGRRSKASSPVGWSGARAPVRNSEK